MRAILIFCLLVISSDCLAEVYKTVDKDGNVTYTDNPSGAAGTTEKINVEPVNIVPAGKKITLTGPRSKQTTSTQAQYVVNIISPTNEYSVPPGQRDLVVAVQIKPGLRRGYKIAYYMNGALLGKSTNNNLSIPEIIRGEHTLRAEVINANGKVLGSSKPITVYVHRVSVIKQGG